MSLRISCSIRYLCQSSSTFSKHCRRYTSAFTLNTVQNSSLRQFSISHRLLPTKFSSIVPNAWRPYLRLMRADKPIGTWLMYWPCTWSIGLATPIGAFPDPYLLSVFGIGAFLIRSSGCLINDLVDKDIDRHVERTRHRPLASGELSPKKAFTCLVSLLSCSLAVLMQLNWLSVAIGASSIVLIVAYPMAKRYTHWPQAFLGLTLNWGVFISWFHLLPSPVMAVFPLYIACASYTIVYDTIYGHQDKFYDASIGVKSTAILFNSKTKPILASFATLMMSSLCLTGQMCNQTWPFYTAVGLTGSHIAWQLLAVKLNDSEDCGRKFRSNQWLGAVLFIGIVLGTYLKTNGSNLHKSKEDHSEVPNLNSQTDP